MTKVQRYKVGFFADEWGMSSITPCLIPDDSGFAVKFEDYCKLEAELAALKGENESLRKELEFQRNAHQQAQELLLEQGKEIDELRRDAERYRWLRDQHPGNKDGYAIGYFDTCGVDAWQMTTPYLEDALNAAMAQGEKG